MIFAHHNRFDPVFDFKYDHQQKVYEAFVDLLCELGTENCETISGAAVTDAQERLLLESYNGVEKFFDNIFVNQSTTTTNSEDLSGGYEDDYDYDPNNEGTENGSSNYGDDEMNDEDYNDQLQHHDYDEDDIDDL
jgi:hypothetical protein